MNLLLKQINMGKREDAIAIVDEYAWYHGGTATIAGFCGGQFGADRVALTVLTTKMIIRICEIYDVSDKAARNIHIMRAIGRLTLRGTAIASTILNWVPLGSFANGFTSYYLTRGAGIQCINDIENEQMTVQNQLINTAKDAAIVAVTNSVGDMIIDMTNGVSQTIIDQAISLSESESGIGSVINDFLDKIPTEANAGIDKAIGIALKETLRTSFVSRTGKPNSKNIIRTVFLNSLIAAIDEHNKFTPEEITFRMIQNEEYYKTFEPFFESTAAIYDEIADNRENLEDIKKILQAISTFFQVKMGLTSEQLIKSVLNNPYDWAIAEAYASYLSLIKISSNIQSLLSKAGLLYIRLKSINLEYHWPTSELNKKDDDLLFMIAGRVKETECPILEALDQESIAYLISEHIQLNKDFYFPVISLPIWGINMQGRRIEYERILSSIIAFWKNKIGQNTTDEGMWSDSSMAAIQAHQIQSLFLTGFEDKYKDDNLIFLIACKLKESQDKLKNFTEQEVAYHTASYFDKFHSAFNE